MRIRDYYSVLLLISIWTVAAIAACPFCYAKPKPPTVEEVIAAWQARTEKIKSFECRYKLTEYHNESPVERGDDLLGLQVDGPDTREETTVARLHSLGYDRGNSYFRGDGTYWNPQKGKLDQQWNWVNVGRRDASLVLSKDGKKKVLWSKETKQPTTPDRFPHPIKLWHEPRFLDSRGKKPEDRDITKTIEPRTIRHKNGVDSFEMRCEVRYRNVLKSIIRTQFAQQPPYRILEHRFELPNGYPLVVVEIDYSETLDAFHFPRSWRVSIFRPKDQSLRYATQATVLDYQINEPVDVEKFELEIPPGTLMEELTSQGMIRALQETEAERRSLTNDEYRELMREMMGDE